MDTGGRKSSKLDQLTPSNPNDSLNLSLNVSHKLNMSPNGAYNRIKIDTSTNLFDEKLSTFKKRDRDKLRISPTSPGEGEP